MSTPQEITNLLNWQKHHAGEVHYSESASTRLAFDSAHLLSTTDCSGMAIRMYRHFGGAAVAKDLKNATYTGNLCTKGKLITKSHARAADGEGMLPGDLVFFTWGGHNPAYDHVAIYAGGGRIWNHGGLGKGPLNWSLRDNVNSASEVMVRRIIQHSAAPHPSPHPVPVGPHLRRPWPKYMGANDFFGLETGGDHSRGGANAEERPDIAALKQRLMALGYEHMSKNGIFGAGTKDAVTAWQKKHYSKVTTSYGEVWSDDWHRLFTY